MENETNEVVAVADAPAVEGAAPAAVEVELKSPSVVEFCTIVNASKTRKGALKTFAEGGYKMSYAALVARIGNYTKKGIKVKELKGNRGPSINAEEVNAELATQEAEAKAAAAIVQG